jgi:branched-subunit amino acid transport protein
VTGIWVVIAALCAGTVALKAFGPVTIGGRRLSERSTRVIGLVAPALLSALVVYETIGADGRGIALDARVAGLAAAAVAIALRRPKIVVVIVAAATAAAARAIA